MPKRRTLKPQSLYARKHLEKWLVEDLEVKPIHRIKIWKGAQKGPVAEIQDSIPRVVREQFDKHFVLTTSQVVEEQVSESGGGKLVVKLQDGHLVETVVSAVHARQQQLFERDISDLCVCFVVIDFR